MDVLGHQALGLLQLHSHLDLLAIPQQPQLCLRSGHAPKSLEQQCISMPVSLALSASICVETSSATISYCFTFLQGLSMPRCCSDCWMLSCC